MSVAATDSKTSYLLDKLQSLSGVIPIGAFLAEHFWSNSYALVSVGKYNDVSRELQQIPWRIIVETCVLFIPILFHGLYGCYIWWTGKSNAIGHPWMANWLYVLQRWTGIVAFIFIGWHFYIVGITCASFHLGNGLWNFACKWGIAVSVPAQRAAGWFGAAVAVTFTLVGVAIALALHYGAFPLGGYVQ